MKRRSIYISTGIILFFLVLCCWQFLPTYLGLCKDNWKLLSDKELIDLAVEELINRPVQPISFAIDKDGKSYQPAYPIYYKSKEEFFNENSDCCSIYAKYKDYVVVHIKYKVNYLDVKGDFHSYFVGDYANIFLDYCGKVR